MSMAGHGFCHIPFELHSWDKGGRMKEENRVGRAGKVGDVTSSDPNIRMKSLDRNIPLCVENTKEVCDI